MDTQKIESIIIDGYTNGKSNLQIANELKEAGCKKVHGNYFSTWDASEYANDKLGLRKKKEHKRSCLKKESGSVSPQTTFEVQNIIVEDQDNQDDKLILIDHALFNKSGKVFTDSLMISKIFNKDHHNVIRDIESLHCSEKFTELNFESSEYKDLTGRVLNPKVVYRALYSLCQSVKKINLY